MLQNSIKKFLLIKPVKSLLIVNLTNKINLRNNLHNTTDDQDAAFEKLRKDIQESNKTLQWRKPPGEKEDAWRSKFKLFGNPDQNADLITFMQQPRKFGREAVKNWWASQQRKKERLSQSYIRERHQILGSDLAAAHFVVHRGGAIKATNGPDWIRADINGDYDLPKRFHPDFHLEAIKCDSLQIFYEGLENMRHLQSLKFWSFHNCVTIDNWCLDRISGAQNPKLEVLDLSGTSITFRGFTCLYRLTNLKLLIIDDPKISIETELTCALLEVAFPKLKIIPAKDIHDIQID